MKRSLAVAVAVFAAALVVVLGAWHFGYIGQRGAGQAGGPVGNFITGLVGGQTPEQMAQAPTFAFRRLEIDTSKPQAEACLVFTRTLDGSGKTHYEDYFTVDPKTATAIRVADTRLCLTGLQFNQSYNVALKPGLPAASGEKLGQGETVPVELRDKPALVRFTGGIILPRDNRDGVPVMTVNVKKLSLKIIRVGDRLLSQLESGVLDQTSLYHWDEQQLENNQGTLVWSGSVDVANLQNANVTTLIPVNVVLKGKPPGAYVLIASDANKKKGNNDYDYSPVAAQWVIDSDIAITTFQGADGLTIFARSYATAKPLDGVKLTLVARNNNLLSTTSTDGAGRADFGAGFFRGKGGDEPVVVMAYGSEGDFSFLDLRRPAFDLTDRGVGGRATPGPIDAFLYTDRGVYRPGETVDATAMLRDRVGKAVKAPLTLIATRPDGMEVGRKVVAGDNLAAGSAAWSLDLNKTAPHGRWQIAAYIDPKADPVGRVQFDVADFVPQRLKVTLTSEQPVLHPKTDFKVRAEARFLYGAPATGLSGDGEARITHDPEPFPDFAAFAFGRVEDSFDDVLVTLAVPETDNAGVTEASGSIGELAATTLPLKAVVKVSIREPGGRTTDKTAELPVRTSDVMIGMRPDFDSDSVGENAKAGFEIVSVDANGKRIARDGLTYSWLKEDTNYEWYQDNNEWKYQAITRDRLISGGTFSISANAPARLSETMPWGSYRLVVTDPKSGASSSYRFYSGWSANASGDRPDRIPVAADKPSYKAGETAHISIKPNADGRALVVVAGDRVFSSQLIRAPKAGASIDIPVSADWGAGAYVLVTHYRALNDASAREPVRSIGVAWLGVDNGARTLGLTLGGPKKVLPRQRLNLPVSIKGLDNGEAAYLTLAAVDEGILQLTEFKSPDPVSYYFGKRRLGVGMRDDYGRLIKAEKGAIGSLREGGDSFGGRPLAVVPTRTVALFSGLVKVDANGNANIPIEIPDFNGELRLMAVAFTDAKLGHANRPLTVRDPVVADLVLPRFLAPGDHIQAGLNLDNVEGKSGSYAITVKATGPVGIENNAQAFAATRDLKAGQRVLVPVALQGNGIGIANIVLTLNGPGLKLTHSWPIEVRSPQLDLVNESMAALPAGKSFTANKTLIANVVPSTANIALTISATAPGYSNVAGQLRWLSKYPYGCIEQTTSGAMPLLYFNDVAKLAGLPGDEALHDRIQNAIDRVLDMQNYGGDFGMWGPGSNADPWVSVFALDFVSQAKSKGYVVPDEALRRGTGWLREIAASDSYSDSARAYAFYVLGHLGQLNLSDLRYFSDTRGPEMKTGIAAALSGAAAASAGDRSRATVQFNRARNLLLGAKDADYTHAEYGSLTRDLAAATALAMESGEDGLIPAFIEKSNNLDMSLKNTTTQEKAWILRAAFELSKQPVPLKIAIDGKPAVAKDGAVRLSPTPADLSNGITFLNNGDARAWRISSVQGSPSVALPAESRGLIVKKTIWTMNGQPADLSKLKQNDRVIVEISGTMDNNYERQMGVIDMLPAGFEIEMPLAGDDAKPYPFLGSLTNTTMRDARDDRFVAAFNIGWPVEYNFREKVDHPDFRVAYIARAITPGRFVLPAAVVEDMYAPAVRARTSMGKVSISQ
ncbi:MAG TPA: alpha-2-macroglobulin [Rhizomicrobium sp.]|nr:alpha-2-macroglobulin [Rhizomicrobium sp.]